MELKCQAADLEGEIQAGLDSKSAFALRQVASLSIANNPRYFLLNISWRTTQADIA
jgi:hypothetical protein